MAEPALAIHGGAGGKGPDPSAEGPFHEALAAALDAGWAALGSGSALDAVLAAVEVLEDAPLFNAGRGSVLTSAGTVEMDAAVMWGADRSAGAVACVTRVRHPVALARAVMERTPHLMMSGRGAESLAAELELDLMKPDWFVTPHERERLARRAATAAESTGTVGAVARDANGALAAATSTGGTRGQLPGRVGDTPIIGAGTWADQACAVSATGHGESVIRGATGHELSALMRHRGMAMKEAAEAVLPDGGNGLIALGTDGPPALPFNSAVMYRGWRVGTEKPVTAID